MKILKAFILFFLASAIVSCAGEVKNTESGTNSAFIEETAQEDTNRTVLIIPLKNLSDRTAYPSSGSIQAMFFNSLYSFISYFPKVSVPEKSSLASLQEKDIPGITNESNPDFIIYGSYSIRGKKSNQEAAVTIRITARNGGGSFSNTYITPTDIGIFDSVDRISEDIGGFLLKEKTRIAHLNFNDFNIGPYEYKLSINNRKVTVITNGAFSLGLTVLSGKSYRITLERLLDSKKLIDCGVVLNSGETTNISYHENVLYSLSFTGDVQNRGILTNKQGTTLFRYKIESEHTNLRLLVLTDKFTRPFKLEISDNGFEKGGKSLHFKGSASRSQNFLQFNDPAGLDSLTNVSIIRFRANIVSIGNNYGVLIGDKKREQFYYIFPGAATGGKWVQFSAPIGKFVSRTDNQPESVLPNGRIELPMLYFRLFQMGKFTHNYGKYDLYFDSVELVE